MAWIWLLFTHPAHGTRVQKYVKKTIVAMPFTNPRDGILYFRREMPEKLGAAFDGKSANADDMYPPAILGPARNTDRAAVLADKERFEAIVTESHGGDLERTGTNWIRSRWHDAERVRKPRLAGPILRLREFDPNADRFLDDELSKALPAVIDEKRTGDEDMNRARLGVCVGTHFERAGRRVSSMAEAA